MPAVIVINIPPSVLCDFEGLVFVCSFVSNNDLFYNGEHLAKLVKKM